MSLNRLVGFWTRRRRLDSFSVVTLLLLCFGSHLVHGARGQGSSRGGSGGGGALHAGVDRECNGIGNLIKSKGFSYPWWIAGSSSSTSGLRFPILPSNSSTEVCPVGRTGNKGTNCCKEFSAPTQRNEMISTFSEKWLGPKLAANAEAFKERKKKFDVTFKDLLTRAHAAFHAMFERTYGMLYIQHAPIFHALFGTLEAYYDFGRESLDGKLNEFFAILTRKMFEVLNAQYEFDESYLSCATIVISEKQGGELHRQIVSSLRRSFVATRALAQGLNDADRVFTNLQKMSLEPECITSLTMMLQCPICAEQRPFKPCPAMCTGVTAKCLSATLPLFKSWNEFTGALEQILDRLLGPYNVEAVVEPIHIKISEAIMNFQESGPDLSQAVFAKCGKPKLRSARNFRKRAAEPAPPENLRERPGGSNKGNSKSDDGFRATGSSHGDTQPSKSLEKLLREIRNKVKKSKGIWESLPRQVCNGISKDYSSQLCWNGTSAGKAERNKTSDEVDVRALMGKGVSSGVVAEQVIILQQITEKLRASYNGLDVQWIQESEELDFGGSGMGSGSGEAPTDTDLEDSDDDDPSGQIRPPSGPTHNNNNQPPRTVFEVPKFPSKPPPLILNPVSNHEDEEDDDEDEEEDDDDDRHRWSPNAPNSNRGNTDDDTDFEFPPKATNNNNKFNPPPPMPPFQPPVIFPEITTIKSTTTSSTTPKTTTTTRRPDFDVKKTPTGTTSSGSLDDTGSKAIALFKLFSPIIASLIGKAFSFH